MYPTPPGAQNSATGSATPLAGDESGIVNTNAPQTPQALQRWSGHSVMNVGLVIVGLPVGLHTMFTGYTGNDPSLMIKGAMLAISALACVVLTREMVIGGV